MKRALLFSMLLFVATITFSQQSFILSGTVKDKKGEPLPGAGVYVSDYKIATSTNDKGNYILRLGPGNYSILVQCVGYKASNKNLIVSDKAITLDFILEESTTQLSEVTIKPDPDRARYMAIFKSYFIGLTENAEKCKIINPEILRIDFDRDSNMLTVKTDDFLLIENKALGYKIKYLLKIFQYSFKNRIIYYEGYPTYEDIPGSENQKKKWAEKRLEAYNGSSQHFFKSLFNNTAKKEGFIINKLIKSQITEDKVDSIAQTQIGGLTSTTLTLSGTKSFNILKKNEPNPKAPITIHKLSHGASVLNRAEILTDTLVHLYNDDIKKIDFTNVLYIIYKLEKESKSYTSRLGLSISRPQDLNNFQISLVNMSISPVYFYKNGAIYNPRSMLYEGYWAWEKMADSVPMDYEPSIKE